MTPTKRTFPRGHGRAGGLAGRGQAKARTSAQARAAGLASAAARAQAREVAAEVLASLEEMQGIGMMIMSGTVTPEQAGPAIERARAAIARAKNDGK